MNGFVRSDARFCWHCGRQLVNITSGPNAGKLAFVLLKNQMGQEVRVHKICEKDVVRWIKGLTAKDNLSDH